MIVLILDDMNIDGHKKRDLRRRMRAQGLDRNGWWSVSTAIAMTPPDEHTHKVKQLLREGRSDARIAKRLGLSRDEVRIVIQRVIDDAHLDDQARVALLAEQVGIVRDD